MDYGVSARQQIGSWWTPNAGDKGQAERLLSGLLDLDPHGTWDFGSEIDWEADPFAQRNWRFQLHSMKWIDPLRRVALSNSELATRSKQQWTKIVRSWCDSSLRNEDDEYVWMDMADGLRAIAFVLGAPLIEQENLNWFKEALEEHKVKLADKNRRVEGNHGLHQIQGLLVVSAFLEDQETWEQAADDLASSFLREYDAQGTNREGSLAYHDLNYQWWVTAIQRVVVEGEAFNDALERLELSRINLAQFVRPDGYLETIGDTAPKRPMSRDGINGTRFSTSSGAEGSPPQDRILKLDAGFGVARSTWGSDANSFKKATFYTARWGQESIHGHEDGGSITIFKDVPWIVDPGMYAYQRHPFRNYFKSRTAHNTVQSLDPNFCDLGTTLVTQSSTEEVDWWLLSADSSSKEEYFRHIIYLRKFDSFIIVDSVDGALNSLQNSSYHQNWHFSPTTEVHVGMRTVTLRDDDKIATMRWLNRPNFELAKGAETPLLGWYSPEYAVAVPTSTLQVIPTTRDVNEWLTTISFGKDEFIPLDYKFYRDSLSVRFLFNGATKSIDLELDMEPRIQAHENG